MLIVVHVAIEEVVVRHLRQPVQTRIRHLLVGPSLLHGVFVVSVEGGGTDHEEGHFLVTVHLNHFIAKAHVRRSHLHLRAEMDAALGVVGKLLLGIVVARQGGIACIAVHRQRAIERCRRQVRQLAAHRHPCTDALGMVGRDSDDDARVWMGGEVFHGILIRSAMPDRVRRGIADVEPALIIAHRLQRVQKLDGQVAQRLIVLREMSLHLPLQAVSLPIVSLLQCLADGGDGLVGLRRIDVHVAGLARPQRDVVERDALPLRTAIHHAAHRTVTDGERLFEVHRRMIVVQRLRHRLPHDEEAHGEDEFQ